MFYVQSKDNVTSWRKEGIGEGGEEEEEEDGEEKESNVSRAYNIQYYGSTTEFNVSSSAVRCLPVGNVLRMSNCVIINIYVARRKQYHCLLLSHLPPFNGIILCSGVFTVFGIFLSMKQVCL